MECVLLLYAVKGSNEGCNGSSILCEMDAEVWENLPEDVLEKVLMSLPEASQFRFRTVCKRWRAIISSAQFLCRQRGICRSATPAICASVILHGGKKARPALASSLYYKLDLAVLPAKFHRLCVPHWCSDCEKIVASQGLVCFCLGGRSRFEVCILNPVTSRWRQLPELHVPAQSFWKMQVDVAAQGSNYRVVVVLCGQCGSVWTVSVFCSQAGSWKTSTGENPPGVQVSRWRNSALLLAGGMIYSWDSSGLHMTIHSVEDARLVCHRNRSLPVAGERAGGCDRRLVEHHSRVYFVSSGNNFRYQIFVLEAGSWTWKPIAVLPDELHDRMLRHCSVLLLKPRHCSVVGDFLCFAMGVGESRGGSSGSRTRLFGYHLVEHRWHLLPGDQLQEEHPLHNSADIRFFRPRWDLELM